MRRPLKPFVTEYKGRGTQPLAARRAHEDHASAPPVNETFLRHASDFAHHGDDSYEAALRAADALFSNGNRTPDPAPGPVTAAEAAPGLPDGPPPRGGRILRAIDEAPMPGLAELEEERAPKRRGRKPGSKNKPKLTDAVPAPSNPVRWEYQWPEDDVPAAVIPRPAQSQASFPPAPADAVSAMEDSAKRRKAATMDYAARQESRFGWVRTKLPPGQQWKRRLPKVCW